MNKTQFMRKVRNNTFSLEFENKNNETKKVRCAILGDFMKHKQVNPNAPTKQYNGQYILLYNVLTNHWFVINTGKVLELNIHKHHKAVNRMGLFNA